MEVIFLPIILCFLSFFFELQIYVTFVTNDLKPPFIAYFFVTSYSFFVTILVTFVTPCYSLLQPCYTFLLQYSFEYQYFKSIVTNVSIVTRFLYFMKNTRKTEENVNSRPS